MSDAPTLEELLEAVADAAIADVRVCLAARIEAYDAATRRATVQVMQMDSHEGEDGERVAAPLAPIVDVPVVGIGARGLRIKFPIRKGDHCLLLISSASIAAVKATGRVSDAGDDRRHHLADAIAIPGVFGFGGSSGAKEGDGDGDEDAMIEFTLEGLIRAGGDEPLVKRSEFMAHIHPETGASTGVPSVSITGTGKLRG